ncbi:hypothetical protein HQ584_01080 [Patescibacteria group bacterium]|nr:hypothetical protein [Patescibacteria group bacterium]
MNKNRGIIVKDVIRGICKTFKTEITKGTFTKSLAIKTGGKVSHARGLGILARTGIESGCVLDIEKAIKLKTPYRKPNGKRNRNQANVDVVLSVPNTEHMILLEYETPDLIEETILSKLGMWGNYYENENIILLAIVIVNIPKEKKESPWEQKDRTKLVNITKNTMIKWSKKYPKNSFAVISIEEKALYSYRFNDGEEFKNEYTIRLKD